MATKMRDLSSDIHGIGESMQKHYDADVSKTQVIDLDVKGLPGHAQADDLKRIAGVKHVISTSVDTNSVTNACTGTGRIKLRLGPSDDLESVKLQYLKAGYGVAEHTDIVGLKSNFTQDLSLATKSPQKSEVDAKISKMGNLQTSGPEVFGNNSLVQSKYNNNFNHSDINQGKSENLNQSHAMQQWKQVSSR